MIYDAIVIGAGQAGMAAGYWLKREGQHFLILDRGREAGEMWSSRYKSLKLFTPRTHSALPGLKLEGDPIGFPNKQEMAAYLKKYAAKFELPIRFGSEVVAVRKEEGTFLIHTEREVFQSRALIVATGPFQQPRVPDFASHLPRDIMQLHSSAYQEPSQLQDGPVLVVGGGNSGAQIAAELADTRETYLALAEQPRYLPMSLFGRSLFWWLDLAGILRADSSSWAGQRLRRQRDPIFGYELKQAVKCGKVVLKTRAVHAGAAGIQFADGSRLTVRNIVWATGYVTSYGWLQVDGALDANRKVVHTRGVSPIEGLYYVGLPWQTHRGSSLLAGVGRDAREVVRAMMIQKEGIRNGKGTP